MHWCFVVINKITVIEMKMNVQSLSSYVSFAVYQKTLSPKTYSLWLSARQSLLTKIGHGMATRRTERKDEQQLR